jgi:hypothetical protein
MFHVDIGVCVLGGQSGPRPDEDLGQNGPQVLERRTGLFPCSGNVPCGQCLNFKNVFAKKLRF